MHVFEVRNAELMEIPQPTMRRTSISYGAIVALIGALDKFTMSTTPAGDSVAATRDEFNRDGRSALPDSQGARLITTTPTLFNSTKEKPNAYLPCFPGDRTATV